MYKKNNHFRHILQLTGLILFVFILTKVDLATIFSQLKNLNPALFLMAIPLILPATLLRTVRWQIFLKSQNIHLPLKESFFIYLYAIFWGSVTPAKSGEFSKILYLKEKGYSYKEGFANTLMDRLFDVFSILVLGYSSLLFFDNFFQKEIYFLSIALIVVVIILILIFFQKNLFKKLLKKIKLDDFFTTLKSTINLRSFFWATLLSIGAWTIYFFQVYLLGLSINLNTSFILISLAVSISSLLNLLPITISGIGTRDLVFILILGNISTTKESAIALSSLVLSIFLINGLIGWLAGFFLQEKTNPNRINL